MSIERAKPASVSGLFVLRYRTARTACLLLLPLLLIALPGCVVGPDYLRPPVPRVETKYLNATEANQFHDENLAEWWMQFNDPILNQLVCELGTRNLELREAWFRIREARARVGVVRSSLFPKFDHTSDYSFKQTSNNAAQFANPLTNRFDFYSADFDARWEIDLFGKIHRSIESSHAQMCAVQHAERHLRITLLADLAVNYVNYRVLQERIRIAESNLDAQQQTLKFIESRLASGLVGPLDQAQAEANAYTTAASIPSLREEQRTTLHRISILLGRVPSENLQCLLNVGPIPSLRIDPGIGVPCDLVRRRPDIRKAECDVVSASAEIGVAEADLYPQLTIRGDIGVDSRQLSTLFTGESMAFGIGPSVRWNLLHWGGIRRNIEARKAAFQQAVARYQQTVLTGIEEVENGLVGYQQRTERAGLLSQVVNSSRRSVELSNARYRSGLIGFQPVLDSQRELLRNEADLAETEGGATISLIQTYKALGGGWAAGCRPEGVITVISETADPQERPPAESLVLTNDEDHAAR